MKKDDALTHPLRVRADTSPASRERKHEADHFRLALAIIAAITLVRVVILVLSPLELYPDEAQYWFWAQHPALGYFSKPPLIAWIIGLSTDIFGNAEWAIRMASPLLHGATALMVFAIAQRTFDPRTALFSAIAYVATPGVAYSSALISTDVPLLFLWAVALYAFLRALESTSWRWPLVLGAAIGFGLLAKYAMLYFFLGAGAAAIFVPSARRFVISARGAAALVLALAIVSPNVAWNWAHRFATVAHTGSNAGWNRAQFNPLHMLGFMTGQFGVFGPLLMAGFLAAAWRPDKSRAILAAFSAPPLALMIVQSFIVSANANWAATAYVAATPLAVDALLRFWHGRALWASYALQGAVQLLLWIAVADPAAADAVGLGNALKREQGWQALSVRVEAVAAQGRYDLVAAENRSLVAELLYYARPLSASLRAISPGSAPLDHFGMTIPLKPSAAHVLVVSEPENASTLEALFDSAHPLESVSIPLGRGHARKILLLDARGYRGSCAISRCGSRKSSP